MQPLLFACYRHSYRVVLLAWIAVGNTAILSAEEPIRFNRDVRPILSDNCFYCHGPDRNQRQADLRLDTVDGIHGNAETPGPIQVGAPEQSELIRRILSNDPDERMPPPESGKEISEDQVTVLRRWIAEGGKVEGHWSFLPRTTASVLSPVQGRALSDDRASAQLDAFIAQGLTEQGLIAAPEADKVTLFRRLHFDLTGLPPTVSDVELYINDDSPSAYERVVDKLLASPQFGERMAMWWLDLVRYADSVGYHGDQEVSVSPFREYVIQSFNQNKPFDQFTIEQLAGDLLPNPTQEQRIASGYNRLGMMSAEGGVQDKEYLAKYMSERVRNASSTWLGITLGCAECHDHKFDPLTTKDFYRFGAFFADIKERGLYSGANSDGNWGPHIKLPTEEQRESLRSLTAQIQEIRSGMEQPSEALVAEEVQWEADRSAAESLAKLPDPVAVIVAIPRADRTPDQQQSLTIYFRTIAPSLEPIRQELDKREAESKALESAILSTLVTQSTEPRMVRVLARGNWMDESGEVVEPAFPSVFGEHSADGKRLTRLDLAHWIVSPDHPLTARVLANRLWKLLFGSGLSGKLDDLGAQGEWPSHPELLDETAQWLVDTGWDIKRWIKLVVMSKTYRQSSAVSASIAEQDPYNRLLARQARYRLDAEMVRDNALAISGLLVTKLGGKSVHPYQPPGYWSYLNFPQREWLNGSGEDLYRRGLYTHWQRQYLHPSLLVFDAPSREECTADRTRSNTPLQSLVLLNDPTYVEAARTFAEWILGQPGTDVERLDAAMQRTLSRSLFPKERDVLSGLLASQREEYRQRPDSASDLLMVGARPYSAELDRVELAAWTSVARVLLNLHETISRY